MSAYTDPTQIPPDVPIIPPPPGYESNFEHPSSQRMTQLIVTVAVCLPLSLICLVARLYTRAFVVRSFGWDDAFALIGGLLLVAMMTSTMEEAVWGMGYYNWDISLRHFLVDLYDGYIFWDSMNFLLYLLAISSLKLSILCLYLRLLGPAHRSIRVGVFLLMAFVVAILITYVAVLLTFCQPAAKNFYPELPGTCDIDIHQFLIQACLQIVTDFLILLPPIPVVLGLNASLGRKLGCVAVLCTGLLVTCISIVRMAYLIPRNLDGSDQYPSAYWSVLETNLALIVICLPALSQLYRRLRYGTKSIPSPFGSGDLESSRNKKRSKRSSVSQIMSATHFELDDRQAADDRKDAGAVAVTEMAPARHVYEPKLSTKQDL